MIVRLYLDEDSMRHSLVAALRARGADVRTALDVNMIARSDEEHLQYAAGEGRVLYSFNVGDYFALHTAWLAASRSHAGIVLARQRSSQ